MENLIYMAKWCVAGFVVGYLLTQIYWIGFKKGRKSILDIFKIAIEESKKIDEEMREEKEGKKDQ